MAIEQTTTFTPRTAAEAEGKEKIVVPQAAPTTVIEIIKQAPTETVVALQNRLQNLRLAAEDGYVYVTGRVDGVVVCVRTRADEVSDAVKQRVLAAFKAAETQLSKTTGKAKSAIVFVDARAQAGALKVKMQCLELRDLTSAKTLEGFSYIKEQAMRVPVPVKVQEGAFFVKTKTVSGYVYFKGGCMRISSKVDDSVVTIKASGVRTYDAARGQAEAILVNVSKTVKRRNAQLQDGIVLVKGKVDNVAVQVRSKAAAGMTSVEEAMLRCKQAVEELRVTKALKNGATVVSDKVNNVTIYVKDGYLHIVSKAGEKVVYVRAQVQETYGATKVRILETYVAADAAVQAALERIVKRALAAYDLTKTSTLAVADQAKARAEVLTERSKALAAEKPITASTVGGATLGATGGGVAGLTAGTVAGAAAGLPLALFTFGLSIPLGAVVGGTAGATVGATVGTTAGAVGGGVVGYGYEHRDQINAGIDGAKNKVNAGVDGAKSKALACKDYVTSTAASLRGGPVVGKVA